METRFTEKIWFTKTFWVVAKNFCFSNERVELGAFKNVKFHKNVFLNVQLGVGLNDQEGYKISNQVLLLTFYCS